MTGLLGGFGHCIGMCGPIVVSQNLARREGSQTLLAKLLLGLQYHAGRLFTYSLIGAVMGLSGSFVNVAGGLAGVQNVVAVFAGLVMIVMGLGIAGIGRGAALLESHNHAVLAIAKKALASTASLRTVLLGLAMGLLPCGLSYTVFIGAAGSGSAIKGAAIAFIFGIGSLPALLLFGTLVSSLGSALRRWITRIGGLVVILMGLYYLYRGISLYAHL
jgi:hypothetical protein